MVSEVRISFVLDLIGSYENERRTFSTLPERTKTNDNSRTFQMANKISIESKKCIPKEKKLRYYISNNFRGKNKDLHKEQVLKTHSDYFTWYGLEEFIVKEQNLPKFCTNHLDLPCNSGDLATVKRNAF